MIRDRIEPVHEHDCGVGRCRFVGVDTPAPGEPRCNQVDVYHCGEHIIVRRYGSFANNYGSWDRRVGPLPPRYAREITTL